MSRLAWTALTANGSIDTTEEATLYVKYVDKPFQRHTSGAISGEILIHTKVFCKRDNFVPVVVPGRSSEAHLTRSAEDDTR